MNKQQSDTATKIKQILEADTGRVFVLKTREKLVRPENLAWFLYPSLENGSTFLSHIQQEGDWITVHTPVFFDVMNDIESVYPRLLHRKQLREDVSEFHHKERRTKYERIIPKVVAFFDALDALVLKVSKKYSTNVMVRNDGGMISAWLRISADDARVEELLRRGLAALKELDNQIGDLPELKAS